MKGFEKEKARAIQDKLNIELKYLNVEAQLKKSTKIHDKSSKSDKKKGTILICNKLMEDEEVSENLEKKLRESTIKYDALFIEKEELQTALVLFKSLLFKQGYSNPRIPFRKTKRIKRNFNREM